MFTPCDELRNACIMGWVLCKTRSIIFLFNTNIRSDYCIRVLVLLGRYIFKNPFEKFKITSSDTNSSSNNAR